MIHEDLGSSSFDSDASLLPQPAVAYQPADPQLLKYEDVTSKPFMGNEDKSEKLFQLFLTDDDHGGDWLANLKYILEDANKRKTKQSSVATAQ